MAELPEIVRQRMARQAGGEHPDADLLTALAEGALGERERTQVLAHLGTCAACREVVSLALPETPALQAAPAARQKAWLGWPVLRWGAVAAAVVIVGAAVMLRQPLRAPLRPESAVPVAKHDETATAKPQPQDNEARAEAKQNVAAATKESVDAKARANAPRPSGRSDKDVAAAESGKKEALATAKKTRAIAAPSGATQREEALDQAQQQHVQFGAQQSVQQGVPAEQQGFQAGAVGGAVQSQQQSQLTMSQQAAPAPRVSAAPAALPQRRAQQNIVASDRAEAATEVPAAGAMEVTSAKGAAKMKSLMRASPPARWRVSSEGKLERSPDGATWRVVPVQGGASFRAVSAVDNDVWAGGAAGVLYHSADGGQTWARVGFLKADIARVEFTDSVHGTVTTAAGETWVTADGGRTWSVRRP